MLGKGSWEHRPQTEQNMRQVLAKLHLSFCFFKSILLACLKSEVLLGSPLKEAGNYHGTVKKEMLHIGVPC